MTLELQPDQQPARWNDHVVVYESVFEPLTNAFAARALDLLDLVPGEQLIDIGAGSGGAALMAAARGANVLAIDAAEQMVGRIRVRANGLAPSRVRAEVMDGTALRLPSASFDAAISVLGVILFADAERGMQEIARVLAPGGRVAIVAWTEPERYELAMRIMTAIAEVRGPQPPPASLPAQLRFRNPAALRNLLATPGLDVRDIVRFEESWKLSSARWLADHLAFAPGMATMMYALALDRVAVLEAFVAGLERDHGRGEIVLSAVAHVGLATKV